jgi:hypothetical protein
MGSQHNSEIEEKREKTFERLIKIIEQKTPQGLCDSLSDCDYLRNSINAVNMTIPEAYGYLTMVCEKYPRACELNLLDENDLKK